MFYRRISDITERKQAEEALRQSEQRWATTLASIGDGVIATDVSGRITFMNAVAEGLTGWALREASQKPVTKVFNVINERTRKEVDNPVTKVLQEGKVIGLANHTVLIRKDGTEVAIDDSGAPIKDERGNVSGVVLVFRDITERKQMEEQLKESEEKSRHLIKYAPSMIYEIDFHRAAFKSVNDAMCHFMGYTREELLAMNPFDLLDDEGKALFRERIRRKLAGEALNDSVEYKSSTKDGREVYGVLNMTFTYKDGNPEGAVVVAHDITERKQAEEALQTTLQRLHTLVASLHSSILLVEDEGRIGFANQAFCDYFKLQDSPADLVGITSNEMIERIKNAYLHPDEEAAHIEEIVRQGQSVTGEEIAMRDGRSCLRDFIPIYVDGKSYGRLWQHTDITERKQAEEALRTAHDQLEKRVQERDLRAIRSHSKAPG